MKTTCKLLAVLLLSSTFSFGQDLAKKIDSIIKDNYKKHPEVGISVGLISHNKEYYTAYGQLSKNSHMEINKKSVFEIASITKILTSNMIAQAQLQNRLQLGDYIDSYLPKAYVLHENLRNKIKIADLASHQSGLPDIDFGKLIAHDPQQPLNQVTEETLVAIINSCNELKDYGQYRYSTIAYTLLGQILEQIYNKPYDELIRERITGPLKMNSTLTTDFDVKNRSTGHNPDGGLQEFFKWNVTAPAGLVKSNAVDLVSYLKAVLGKGNAIADGALITEKIFLKDEKREMGLGLNIHTDDTNTIYLKSGDSMGQSSIICYNRAKNWGIIILLDKRDSKMRQNLLNEIYETVLK